jgi:hypothetical protein
VGLVSAAVSDHTQIDALATELQRMGARISASSMRMDPISVPLIRALAETGAQNLTVAPEAGSAAAAQRDQQDADRRADDARHQPGAGTQLPAAQALLHGRPPHRDRRGHPGHDRLRAGGAQTFQAPHCHQRHALRAQGAHALSVGRDDASDVLRRRQKTIHQSLARHGVDVRADSPDWAEVQAVLSRGDRRLADVLLAIPSGGLTVRSFFQTMADLGLEKEHYTGAGRSAPAALGCGAERRQRELLSLRTAAGQPEQDRAELPARQRRLSRLPGM